MSKQEQMRELFEKADKVQPMAEKDGQVYVNFDEAATLNNIHSFEGGGTGLQMRNRDGSLASTGKRVHAINPDYFFSNRYKKKGKTLMVVSGQEPTGFRCIQEQETGHIHIKTIKCYVFTRDDSGAIVLDKVSTVSDAEFISDFTHTLTNKSMAEILPLITAHGEDMSADDMPI